MASTSRPDHTWFTCIRRTPATNAQHGDEQITYRRTNRNLHLHGYKEEGTITTAFDMRVQNELDRFHLVQSVVDCVPPLGSPAPGDYLKQMTRDKLIEHKHHIDMHGQDLPEIRNRKWPGAGSRAP